MPLKTYDVSGEEIEGRVMPAGSALRLSDEDAERYGLKRPSRQTTQPAEGEPAETKKRPAPRGGRRPRS